MRIEGKEREVLVAVGCWDGETRIEVETSIF